MQMPQAALVFSRGLPRRSRKPTVTKRSSNVLRSLGNPECLPRYGVTPRYRLYPDPLRFQRYCASAVGIANVLERAGKVLHWKEVSPFLRRAILARYAPDALARRGWRALASGLDILTGLPQGLRQLLRSARSGKLQVHVGVTRLQHFGNRLDRAMSRLTMGIVIAALIIGSSIVMIIKRGPVLLGLPLFGLLGFIGSVLGGIWLLISIWRSKRGP